LRGKCRADVEAKWNFFWANRYGFGFRLWVVELQVYFYRPGGWEG
jgi:hypothetical protein